MAEKTQRSCADPNIGRELRCGHSRLERRTLQGFSHSTRPELRRSRLWHHWARRQINRALFTSRGSSCSPALSFLQKRVFHVSNLQIVALNPHKRHASPADTRSGPGLAALADHPRRPKATPHAALCYIGTCGNCRSHRIVLPSSDNLRRWTAGHPERQSRHASGSAKHPLELRHDPLILTCCTILDRYRSRGSSHLGERNCEDGAAGGG
mmetsp:Transcript_3819/g.8097  ORF Transcript_3819/g.8097 Transcript_3819/m.8097 type:complete len:210 (+) Transcript_3819:58-687(+)